MMDSTSPTGFYPRFWTEFLARLRDENLYSGDQRPFDVNWMCFPSGYSGLKYCITFAKEQTFRIQLYIDRGKGKKKANKALFDALELEKEEIEKELEVHLSWQRLEHAQACRIADDRPYTDRDAQRSELIELGIQRLAKMKQVFDPRIRRLLRK